MPDPSSIREAPDARRISALRSRRVVTPEGVRDAAVLIRGGVIEAVVPPDQLEASHPVEDLGDLFLLPGLVDTHVHINEPGRAEWEGFATATRAAAAGGITTLVDMPLNSSPVTTTVEALALKEDAARGRLWVDCGFYGGIVPSALAHVEPLTAAGVLGFKAFLCPSGIDEFPEATESDLRAVMPRIGRSRLPLLVHAELPGPSPIDRPAGTPEDRRSYSRHQASRPREWEHDAIRLLITLCRETLCRIHVVHLSSAEALPLLAEARAEGLPLSVETCPHYLTFVAEEIPDGNPLFKCAPPIRSREDREHLWEGLRRGIIDTIGSDHSPAPPDLKHLATGDLERAWGGISSLQLALPAVWTGARARGFSIVDLAGWMAHHPAQLVGISGHKGSIAPGRDADLVAFDPDATIRVDPSALFHRHHATPYEGMELSGKVEATWLRGRVVFRRGVHPGAPSGRAILSGLDPGRGGAG